MNRAYCESHQPWTHISVEKDMLGADGSLDLSCSSPMANT